ncbi:hypothetical protein C8A00DRAFT_12884 [Chaetomidium leptoderma]|uniref:TauD/TfdA-like domain-containing protein n=1 Tax=Chaetomidium leptoderma TaxID=669021 RepID=A0AAN6VTZ4_9PEZI|nr:hypothetical protein C8A00DRAFT_12884 [Chaetomidium leptoderma]
MASAADSSTFTPQYEPQLALLEEYCERNPVPEGLLSSNHALPTPWPSRAPVMAWKADDLHADNEYIACLSDDERREIMAVCAAFTGSGKSLNNLDASSFPLPLLADRLAATRKNLHEGLGMAVLRGLDISSLPMRDIFAAFSGLASHVSERRGRQSGGKTIVHITDLSGLGSAVLPAPYQNSPLPFHTDPAADIVAMFVVQPSLSGGQGTFSSVATVYNTLATRRPDLLHELAAPDWPFARAGAGPEEVTRRPVMFLGPVSGAPEMLFSRGSLVRSGTAASTTTMPYLTHTQNAALDAVHFAARDTACSIEYAAGDVLFFNNRRVLHGRESFSDGSRLGGLKRHVLRLWLRDEERAGMPPAPMAAVWERTFAKHDHREHDEGWPLEPDRS